MKTSDLKSGTVYATNERPAATSKPGLLLDTALWRESDEWEHWDGASARTTRARIVRKAFKGARVEKSSGWRDFYRNGLPVLVLNVLAWDFSEGARGNQIAETPLSILERARDTMNVMGLVADGFDGRPTPTTARSATLSVETVGGGSREVCVDLEFLRPQQVVSQWGPYLKQKAHEDAAKAAIDNSLAEASAKSVAQAQGFVERLNALLGEEESPRNHQGERYDFHREWTSGNNSSTYQVRAEILARLLDLAEKGQSA